MPWIHIAIIILLIVGAIMVSSALTLLRKEFKRTGKHPKGYYLGVGIAIVLPLGVPVGIIVGNIALGPIIGFPIGIALGSFLEIKNKNKLRSFTEQEEKMQYNLMFFLTGVLLLGVLTFLSIGLF